MESTCEGGEHGGGGGGGGSSKAVLYSFCMSSCSWRVRTALAMKGIDYEYKAVNIIAKDQENEDFLRLNLMKQVPVLIINDHVLAESVAILEYLEEVYPEPKLLPSSPYDRAIVRQLTEIINAGTQPFQNLRLLNYIGEVGGAEARAKWAKEAITRGLGAFEDIIRRTAGTYSFGESITFADIALIPQLRNARNYGVDLGAFPTIQRVETAALKHPAVVKGHPLNQPDAPL